MIAGALAFAAGALIVPASFELCKPAFQDGAMAGWVGIRGWRDGVRSCGHLP